MITIVAALIEKEGKVLIAKRSTGDSNVLGKWEFPGGKVQDNEEEKLAIAREIKEELEIVINADNLLCNNIYNYPNKKINLKLYNCIYVSGNIKLHDHSMYSWVNKEDLLKYDLAPADVALAKFVMEVN